MISIQVDYSTPNFIESKLMLNGINDEVDWLQFGYEDEYDFISFEQNRAPIISAHHDFPNDYKVTSLEIQGSYDRITYNRQTDDILLFLGDLGGWIDLVLLVFGTLAAFFGSFEAKHFWINKLFTNSPAYRKA